MTSVDGFAARNLSAIAPVRWLVAALVSMLLLSGIGWMAPQDAAAGQGATIVVDSAPLFADHDDHTVIGWMPYGDRVDIFWGPHNWLYEVRHNGVVGWTWQDYLELDGQGGTTSSAADSYDPAPEPAASTWQAERWIDVNRSTGAVTLYEGNTALYVFWGSLSRSQGEDFYATASGTYYVYNKHLPLVYTPYAENYFTHWVGFDSGRFNGFHSYVKYSDGSIHPNGAGPTAGCVALAPGEIDILYDFAYVGMRVEVHW